MADATLTAHEARQRLHEIVRKDTSFDEKAHEALELGKQYLSVDNSYLTRIDQETDHWEIVVTTDTPDGQPSPDLERDLQKTYCRETIDDDFPFALHDAPNQGWADDPAFETSGKYTYLGIPLIIGEEPYGTVCFAAENSRSDSFGEAETQFADHLTRLLERELEKEHIKGDLTSQTNLATVLNRVLRHNLRNDISVIRGHTELIAEQLDDDPQAETVLNHIDGLIDLTEKARELEEVITTNSERQPTEICTLIENIAAEITQEYPAASVSVEYDYEIRGNVLQNFGRAMEELIENAVKHSGEDPSVTVTIERVPNNTEIQIRDNGPGLPDHETKVFTAGEEIPLAHGSGLGLWLAYWIITNHDGSIDPEITQYGTTMNITIPRKLAVTAQQQLPELRRSRDKYKTAFEEAREAITIVNDDGNIMNANEAASTIFGVETQKLLGRSLTEFLSDDFAFEAEWQDFQETGIERDTTTVISADGVERIIEYSGTVDIIPGQHLLVSRDVTEQRERERELERLKERYQTLIEAAPDPVFVADAETGKLIEVNEAAETLLGMSSDEITGMHQSELHPPEQTERYQQLFEQQIESGVSKRRLPDGSHITIVTDNGDRVPVVISVGTVSLSDGPVIYGIFRDVSEQVERERELEEISQRLQLALEGTDTGVWDWNIGTDDVRWSESLERLVGIKPGTFGGTFDAFAAYIHPDDREKAIAAVEQAAETESRFQTEYRIQCENGSQIWVEARGEIYNNDDDAKRMVGIATNISERKEREAEMTRKTEAMEKAPVGITLTDPNQPDNPMVYANERFCELTGYEESKIVGRNCRFMQGPETDSESVAEIRNAIDNEEPVTTVLRNYRKDGTMFWNRLTIAPVRNTDGAVSNWVGFQEDVTERIEREQQLELSEVVFENTRDALALVDVVDDQEYRLDPVNEAFEALTSYTTGNITGTTPTEMLGDEIGGDIQSQLNECVTSQEPVEFEQVVPTEKGSRIWQVQLTPLIQDGEVTQLVIVMRNITERKEKLRRFRKATEAAGHAIYFTDPNGVIEYVNPAFEDTTGYTAAEAIGTTPRILKSGEHDDDFYEELWETILSGEVWRSDIINETKSGEQYVVDQTIAPLEDEKGDITHFIAINIDITEQHEFEETITRQNERLETFVGTVSHDLHGPLRVAEGQVELAQQDCDSEHLQKAEEALDRGETLLEELLTLARQGETVGDVDRVELAPLAESCWRTIETANATLMTDIDQTIQADKSRLKELLENLYQNAISHGGADVTISVGELADGFYVEDDGAGIPPTDREQVFTAGYSTAPEGTGFGLRIVKEIVDAHGWSIRVAEESGGGARFEITGIEFAVE